MLEALAVMPLGGGNIQLKRSLQSILSTAELETASWQIQISPEAQSAQHNQSRVWTYGQTVAYFSDNPLNSNSELPCNFTYTYLYYENLYVLAVENCSRDLTL